MAEYKAPLRDIRFVLNEVFKADELWASLPELAEVVDAETADAILEEGAKLTARELAPLNRSGDEEGARWDNGDVTTPAGLRKRLRPTRKVVGSALRVIRNMAAWACRRCSLYSLKR